ncbi:hypothetical protein CW751_11815 [Brumimicrobium salinarum]|uniref:Uncharacterized protein n=1 Tax=Brumimicrobium salinarum TaxID=2058658 RepID=A0A2I0R0D7_9FLAO|nr:hypothetical protein CW751_11815 [Brumimicrobium salinarum]
MNPNYNEVGILKKHIHSKNISPDNSMYLCEFSNKPPCKMNPNYNEVGILKKHTHSKNLSSDSFTFKQTSPNFVFIQSKTSEKWQRL